MWNYNPKKHGKHAPVQNLVVSDGAERQPPAPAVEHYRHTHFSTKTKEGQLPVMDKDLYPSIAELSSGSFLDPDYTPSAEVQGGEEEESTTCASRLLGDHPLLVWSQLCSEFLNEILKLDAFEMEDNDACEACKTDLGLPLHKIEVSAYEFYYTLDVHTTDWNMNLHLDTFGKVIPEEEKSTCNNHDAIKLANSRGGHGAAATGVGAVVCGRHDMKCPMSVGDLQKGERYLNMDYFVLSTLSDDMPPELRNILYLVPKFHLPAHVLKCRDNFFFNFSAGVGHTDGEAPEHGWAATNALAASTKEMGPGTRQDTLDDHFGDYNWRKIIILGMLRVRVYEDSFFCATF
ncbi:hypothetical protein ARMGADRAFT_1032119 [Armillaria gallica]|uniref:CxC2-like cysteine cluster KDZ transposase-associated domain-containing protein n=1 Tax=Armillaria gallica TaxID=47427 RepID=A0A2H3DUB7_ARMGA|nr:hypothetical protein ARMGADRAFT_1032119 [Armillaria gallica]